MSQVSKYNFDVEYIKSLIKSQDIQKWKSGLTILGCYNPFSGTIYSTANCLLLQKYVQIGEDGSVTTGFDNIDRLSKIDLRFASFKQLAAHKLKVKKGAKSRFGRKAGSGNNGQITYKLTKDHPSYAVKQYDLSEDERNFLDKNGYVRIPCNKPQIFRVFHFSDIEDAETLMQIKVEHDAINNLINLSEAKVINKPKSSASYSPKEHCIKMPLPSQYNDVAMYYAALLHEFAHWTQHESVLGRYKNNPMGFFGDALYAREELVAEISAVTLCNTFGIVTDIQNHESYIKSWATLLTDEDIRWALDKSRDIISYVNLLIRSQNESVAA